ncbi:G-protein coupled receptor [Biomphalaria pfeifferi]|uniref:G-protein coupled receptor n=1 Tax=Biomphalaria pfeifferi TaxID=112525 RepID=A0AAD8C797_BIOPF|nr:G-protein coupled receptor [Biomphalaria pfeifferi]
MNNGTASNRVEYYYIRGAPTRMLEQINIYFVLMCFVKPAMSILGITANIIKLQILRLSGLHKPSNILLFSLVIADTLCLGRSINYGAILFWFGPDDVMCGFHYSEGINYFLLYSMIVTFGNIVLGIKVSAALKKRRSLTSSQKMSWSPRTTRTLMLTCFFFVISTATGTIMTQMDNNLIEDVASY